MNELVTALLLGYVLGAVPSSETGRISVAALGKRLGVEPKEIEKYNETDTDNDE